MLATDRTKICSTINSSPSLRGMGIVFLGAHDEGILQRPPIASPRDPAYVLILEGGGSGPPPDATLRMRLRRLGIEPAGFSIAGGSPTGSPLYGFLTVGGARQSQDELFNLQKAMQRENLVFSSVSNVLKTRHDTAKNSLGNYR